MHFSTTVLGYPRIGERRELKTAIEGYWAGRIDAEQLQSVAEQVRRTGWKALAQAGIEQIPSNTFSLYDHVLDTAVAVDAIAPRHRALGLSPLDTYFAMARGTAEATALELTKWFDTNYHHLVPELSPATTFAPVPGKLVDEFSEARQIGLMTRPVLVGPVTFLLLSKPDGQAPQGFTPLDLLDPLLDAYEQLLAAAAQAGAQWIQLDEPAFTADRTSAELAALRRAYTRLAGVAARPKLLVTGSYGHLGVALDVLLDSEIEGVGLDLVAGIDDLDRLAGRGQTGKVIAAGVVDGRNVWRTKLHEAAATLDRLAGQATQLWVSTSCSLLHLPYDVTSETDLDPAVRGMLSFAWQKAEEIVLLGRTLSEGAHILPPAQTALPPAHWHDPTVRARLVQLAGARRAPATERLVLQQKRWQLPALATTTIGSFPQTAQVRSARAGHRAGRLSAEAYHERMREEIARVIALQERLGLDVLVHGEPERNDMVQYFAEQLDGFATTVNGWVQSYGTRCVRPPILYADVRRRQPMTTVWASYAQSLTSKPVKGMLTGPVTILAWSYVRDDQPLADTALQVALALRDETQDLEAAGIGIIQVDEPALRELLPPRRADHAAYLDWAVSAFRLATSGVAADTQIHTHLCYSEFGVVLPAIDALDADVTSIEASRSNLEILAELATVGYSRGVGPGVYDIHSPRVPTADEMAAALRQAAECVQARLLWVNPDCGLKTRDYSEVEPALAAMVTAARTVRAELGI